MRGKCKNYIKSYGKGNVKRNNKCYTKSNIKSYTVSNMMRITKSYTKGELKRYLTRFLEVLLRTIYPRHCLFCDGLIPIESGEGICAACINRLVFLTQDLCDRCGKPLTEQHSVFCYDCRKGFHLFTKGRALWLYEGAVKEAIHRFKYYNRKDYARLFGEELYHYFSHHLSWSIDMIIPIPLHKKRLRTRGYNQAGLLAHYLGRRLKLPVHDNVLIRTRDTKPQKELSDIERIFNVQDAFAYSGQVPLKGGILLIDDIYTTGNTIDNAAKVLLSNGASRVYFLTLAIGKGL